MIRNILTIAAFATLLFLGSCDKTESYSELLREEEKAVNWYLAQHRVEMEFPEENYEIGDDAPFYRMDAEGNLYMQILNPGDLSDKPQEGDKVYFRYERKNLKSMYEGGNPSPEGNMDDLLTTASTSFFKGNNLYPSTTGYGTGIQIPVDYLGYYSEVNLVLKSYIGFTSDMTQCTPYLIKVKYYKPEY